MVIGAPSIFGKGDRRAGAGTGSTTDPMSVLAQAIQSQTAEIDSLVKAKANQSSHPQGSVKGFAGPYWGSMEKHCLGAANFIHYTDAELDAFATERQVKGGVEQKPAPPSKLEDWVARVKRQNEVWRLLYGKEWKDVREHCADTLAGWHQECPHKLPLQVVTDAWKELHWRFMEEIKELIGG